MASRDRITANDASTTPEKTHLAHISKLFHDPQYSDLIIECQDRQWNVHKSIISSRCAFFAKACDGRFKEGPEGKLLLPADDPHAVHAMLSFIYRCDYNDADPETSRGEDMPPILVNVGVAVIADKYNLAELSSLACKKFTDRAQTEWRSQKFATAVRTIYNMEMGIATAFRSSVIQVCVENASNIFSVNADGNKVKDMLGAIRAIPDLGADLAQCLLRTQESDSRAPRSGEKRYECAECEENFVMQDVVENSREEFCCPYCGGSAQWKVWHAEREIV